MASEKKTLSEMMGEFLRESGLLIMVFIPIDVMISSRWSVPLFSLFVLGSLAVIAGVIVERKRT